MDRGVGCGRNSGRRLRNARMLAGCFPDRIDEFGKSSAHQRQLARGSFPVQMSVRDQYI